MDFSSYLAREWVPALGCTEPASIALAAATAAAQGIGEPLAVALVVDPRIYKNCYAVGIPHSGHRTGILWAAAIGANVPDTSLGLECFRAITPTVLGRAERMIAAQRISVDVDATKQELSIDCRVTGLTATARIVIARDHTNIIRVERDGAVLLERPSQAEADAQALRRSAAALGLDEMIALAKALSEDDRERLREGIRLNRRICEHGLSLFPQRFLDLMANDPLTTIATHVCAGVYARMWGEDLPVMSLAGSGNKGIVASVPLAMHGEHTGCEPGEVDRALALAALVTSATTFHLGTLSAVCGCSNAAGIGLAAGIVLLSGGGPREIGLALNNMVGNVTGMICDGAKIGCALKTMTAVDAAFRAAALAMGGMGIPASDGIVGHSGQASLENLGRIATSGMQSADREILAIMAEKLSAGATR
jgi:L-cysteine desulfidase